MAARVTDRLLQARRRQFVDRSEECRLLESALASPRFPFQVLYVYGPGGVGKSALLNQFSAISHESHFPTFYLDARNVEPTPRGFSSFVESTVGAPPNELEQMLANTSERQVILVDTFENLEPLEDWLRETFLPSLPERVLFVFAGRNAPSLAWRRDPGWQSLLQVLPLRNLTPEQAQSYLEMRNVPRSQQQAVLDFTHGHPLALSLVADAFAQRPNLHFQPEAAPDVVRALIEQFVQKVPSPAHRAALEACSLVRVTTEGLLATMLSQQQSAVREHDRGVPEQYTTLRQPATFDSAAGVHELFEWVRELSFVESSTEGLFPHDLAREALTADLRWRNPDWYKELHQRARAYYVARIQRTRGVEQQVLLLDFVFLHRDNPVIRSMLEWKTGSGVIPDSMRESDRDILVEMVRKHEGDESAQIAKGWLARQPDNVTVYRDDEGRPLGMLAIVQLERAAPQEIQQDPATRLAWDYLQRQAPLRPGEVAVHYRFWMAHDTYQNVSAVQTAVLLSTVRYQLTTHGLGFHFLPCADPDAWAGAFSYANLRRLTETDYTIGGKCYGVYGHDWRAEPPVAWLALLAEREVAAQPNAVTSPSTAPAIVLSEPDFGNAVRSACKDYWHPEALEQNPLIQSRMVSSRIARDASASERVTALQQAIREAAESLEESPRDAKLYRALVHTYLKPATTQEMAAEQLDLPFSTFRRHLKVGVDRLTEILWHKEIGR